MANIKISELSSINHLDAQETTNVVGGGYYGGYYYPYYGYGYGGYNKAKVYQSNSSYITQVAFGGGYKSPATNIANVNQNNNSVIKQY